MTEPLEIVKKSFVRKQHEAATLLDYGKLPPQAVEIEEAVLGAAMLDKAIIHDIANIFHPAIFYKDNHQRICRAILQLHADQSDIDLLTVTEQLKKNGELDTAGGPYAVAQLTNKVGSTANVHTHLRILLEKYIMRGIIAASQDATKNAYEDTTDPIELLDRTELQFRALTNQLLTGEIENLDTQVDEAMGLIMQTSEEAKKYFIESKHATINNFFNGWQRETLNIIAARPGMGKTAFAVSEAVSLLSKGYRVLWFNPEMSKKQLQERVLSTLTKIPIHRIRKKNLHGTDEANLYEAAEWHKQRRNHLMQNFTSGIQINHIHNLARKIKLDRGLDVIIIDYLQLLTIDPFIAKGITRDQYIGHITRELKAIAKSLQVAVICFCQVNRLSESKPDKRPTLAELRESGNIEQDADTVSFLYRPEYYFKREDDRIIYETPEQEEWKNICQFICGKNRQDSVFETDLYCELGISTFYDTDNTGEKIDVGVPF